jgi:hypothetical protein
MGLMESREKILAAAREFRRFARETHWVAYTELLNRTADDLEILAASAEPAACGEPAILRPVFPKGD